MLRSNANSVYLKGRAEVSTHLSAGFARHDSIGLIVQESLLQWCILSDGKQLTADINGIYFYCFITVFTSIIMHDKYTYFWIFWTVGFYLNCGVTLTWCMFSIFSMSSPEHTNTLHCLQLRLILDGDSFIIPFCCFFFIFTFSSIMACIWNSLIYTKPNDLYCAWGIMECIFWSRFSLSSRSLLDSSCTLWRWLCSSFSRGIRLHSLSLPPQILPPPPVCNYCPLLFLDHGPAEREKQHFLPLHSCGSDTSAREDKSLMASFGK